MSSLLYYPRKCILGVFITHHCGMTRVTTSPDFVKHYWFLFPVPNVFFWERVKNVHFDFLAVRFGSCVRQCPLNFVVCQSLFKFDQYHINWSFVQNLVTITVLCVVFQMDSFTLFIIFTLTLHYTLVVSAMFRSTLIYINESTVKDKCGLVL